MYLGTVFSYVAMVKVTYSKFVKEDIHPQKLTGIPKMMAWRRWTPFKYMAIFGYLIKILGDFGHFFGNFCLLNLHIPNFFWGIYLC